MIIIVLKCSFRNYEFRITDTMKQAKCVCLPFSEYRMKINICFFRWLKTRFHSKTKQFGCNLE